MAEIDQQRDPILRLDQFIHRQDVQIMNQLETIRLLKVVIILQGATIFLAALAWLIKIL